MIKYLETDGECNLPESDARFKVTKDTKQVEDLCLIKINALDHILLLGEMGSFRYCLGFPLGQLFGHGRRSNSLVLHCKLDCCCSLFVRNFDDDYYPNSQVSVYLRIVSSFS